MFSNYGLIETHKGKIIAPQQKNNIEGINLYFDKNYIAIQRKMHSYKKHKHSTDFFVINRRTQELKIYQSFEVSKMTKRVFSAFLGIVVIKGCRFVVLCDEAKISTNQDNIIIYQIASLYFLSYLSDKQLSKKGQKKQIFQQIRQLYEILRFGFYFSYKYNLTQSFQHQQMGIKNRFTWNTRFLTELEKYKIQKQWCLPIIQGYVNSFEVFIEGTKITYILISRRSNKKAGTRYFDRGINEEGYVANFVQTQQIIKIDDYYISDTQIRGSVPLFFQQKGLRTLVKLTRGYQLTHQVYKKHMSKLKDRFQRVFFVNLLCRSKRGQNLITEQLQKHIKQQKLDRNIRYMYFDFHKAVQDGDYSKIDSAIEKVRQMKQNLGYFIYDTNKKEVIDQPEGIFRTNCLDCLDRTNFFQAKLALISLQNIFKKFNIQTQSLLKVMNSGTDENQLIKRFRNIWADNGDMISYHYTGTGSTHTDITRDGKRGLTGEFKHKYKSIARFYNQNFLDFYRMNLIDLLLDQKKSQFQNNHLPNLVKQRQAEFVQKKILDIYLFSWKVPSKIPSSLVLFPTEPLVIAINLQQVGDVDKWNKLIKDAIHTKYILIGQKFSNNNLLKIYVRSDLKSSVSNVQMTKVKFKSYYNQIMSSKCSVIIRFKFGSSRLVFCGCQLEYGRQFSANRVKNLRDLHEYAFQQVKVGEKRLQSILNDDIIFLFGNMNTHISSQYKQKITKFQIKNNFNDLLQQKKTIQQMVETDQFYTQIKQSLLQFRQYQEQQIQFLPTYKYSGGAFEGQKSGWPDRIWYSSNNKIICSRYGVLQQLRDSHVPIIGQFQVQVQKIDQQLKAKIFQQVYLNQSSKNNQQQIPELQKTQNSNQTVEVQLSPFYKSKAKENVGMKTSQQNLDNPDD